MKDGKCLKCESDEVYFSFSESSMDAGLRAGEGQIMFHTRTDSEWMGNIYMGFLTYYLCRNCGYVEIYSNDTGALDLLKASANWMKVKG